MGTLSKSGTMKADPASTSTVPVMEETKMDLGKLQEAELEAKEETIILANPRTAAQFTSVGDEDNVASNGDAEISDTSKGDMKNEVSVPDSEVTTNMAIAELDQESCLEKDGGITSDADVIINPVASETAAESIEDTKCNSPLPATGPESGKQELEVLGSIEVEAATDTSDKEVEVAIEPKNEEVTVTETAEKDDSSRDIAEDDPDDSEDNRCTRL